MDKLKEYMTKQHLVSFIAGVVVCWLVVAVVL